MELSARLQGRLMVPRNGTIRIQSFTAQYKLLQLDECVVLVTSSGPASGPQHPGP